MKTKTDRNLITTIKLTSNQVIITCLENINNHLVEIFNDSITTDNNLQQVAFVKKATKEINKSIGGEIKSIVAIIPNDSSIDLQIELIKQEYHLKNSIVTHIAINQLLELVKTNYQISSQRKIILMQPIRYFLEQGNHVKTYNYPPINKRGNGLELELAIATIKTSVVEGINHFFKKANLSVSQIFTEAQILPYAIVANLETSDSIVTMHIGQTKTFLAVNLNLSVAYATSINLGYQDLVQEVSNHFNCNYEYANNLLKMYANLTTNSTRIVYQQFTKDDLNKIIINFFVKFEKKVNQLLVKYPILNQTTMIINGKLNQITNFNKFITKAINFNDVLIYKPLSFVATNPSNLLAIGVNNFICQHKKLIAKDFDTIVTTNPNNILVLNNFKSSFFSKFLGKIGGRYVRWNKYSN